MALDPRQEALPWRRGLVWLLLLGPFFFLSYGFANWWAGNFATPGTLFFEWERGIPFVPWTIVPYWSIDLLYGLSFLLCRNRREVDTHALRLLSVQLLAVACFILFPLRFSFERPATDGVFGWMFDVLMGFDKPFNQAPSLHIALLVILWVRYAAVSRGVLRLAVHAYACLIGISVLTTYQHHFIDVPTGALAGLFCLWLWPDAPHAAPRPQRMGGAARRFRIAGGYLLGAILCAGMATSGGAALWLLWPGVSLGLVAAIYLFIGAGGFQKREGSRSVASACLLAPYTVGAWINSRWWRRPQPDPVLVCDGVWLGRMPTRRQMLEGGFRGLCDLAPELPSPRGDWINVSLPWLDLIPPDAGELARAAEQIEQLRHQGTVLVCCALGLSRSAVAVAAWLLCSGRAESVDAALRMIALLRPAIVIGAEHRAGLQRLVLSMNAKGAKA
ncbi:MAG: phosphatase PAP2/dual specificity phosphatase family protein [Betaproteobacteria bacterium]